MTTPDAALPKRLPPRALTAEESAELRAADPDHVFREPRSRDQAGLNELASRIADMPVAYTWLTDEDDHRVRVALRATGSEVSMARVHSVADLLQAALGLRVWREQLAAEDLQGRPERAA